MVAGTAGQGRPFAEEVDRNPGALQVTITEQTHEMTAAEGVDDLPAGVGTERMDLHPQRLAQADEPVEQFGGIAGARRSP